MKKKVMGIFYLLKLALYQIVRSQFNEPIAA